MSNPPHIVVDNDDPIVQYGGSWFRDIGSKNDGNFGQPFLGSQQATTSSGATLIIPFKGTTIEVFGTSDVITGNSTSDPSWECFVDGISIGVSAQTSFPQNNWPLCGKMSIAAGDHQLVLKVGANTRTFWFDFATYTPTPDVSFDSAISLISFTDPMITFDSSWVPLGTDAKLTAETGSTASFNFIGKAFYWYGWAINEWSHTPSTATYTVDGGPPVPFALKGLDPGPQSTQFNVLFFSINSLKQGSHHVSVQFTGLHNETALTLTHLIIVNETEPTPVSSSTISSPTPSSTGVSGSSTTFSAGGIAGGIVGGLAFFLALLCLFFFWRSRRNHASPTTKDYSFSHNHQPLHPTLEPFELVSSSTAESRNYSYRPVTTEIPSGGVHKSVAGLSATSSSSPGRPHVLSDSSLPLSNTAGPSTASGSGLRGSANSGSSGPSGGSGSQVLFHLDSGVRIASTSTVPLEELPPVYTHE